MEALIAKYRRAEAGRSLRAFMGKEKISPADNVLSGLGTATDLLGIRDT